MLRYAASVKGALKITQSTNGSSKVKDIILDWKEVYGFVENWLYTYIGASCAEAVDAERAIHLVKYMKQDTTQEIKW